MSRQRASIPILGIDERPNERQKVPGIADDLENLRPTGLKEEPVWIPISHINVLKNSSSQSYAPGDTVVKAFWHVRGRVGKNGDENGSLRRLVVLTSGGVVKVIDPDLNAGWDEVVTDTVTSADSGEWDMHLSQMYDIGYITVTKGGIPQKDLILEDDLLVEFVFPELPVVRVFPFQSDESYDQLALDGGTHKGLKEGFVFVRYAFVLTNRTMVKHSAPEFVQCKYIDGLSGEKYTNYLNFYLEGYDQISTPDNIDYWKEKITGVAILISEFDASVPTTKASDGVRKISTHLENTVWYELDRFDTIDAGTLKKEDRLKTVTITDEEVFSLLTADVDDYTHHSKYHGESISYNSRMILGRQSTNFSKPALNNKENTVEYLFYCTKFGEVFVLNITDHPDFLANDSVAIVNESFVTTTVSPLSHIPGWKIEYNTTDPSWSFKIEVTDNYGNDVNCTLNASRIGNNIIIPFSQVSAGIPVIETVTAKVVIDSETGLFSREKQFTVNTNVNSVWMVRGKVLFYPDIRAKKIILRSGASSGVREIKLTPSKKANIAFAFLDNLNLSNLPLVVITENYDNGNEFIPNKVVVSDINNVFSFESDLVYVIGRSNEQITGFAVNVLAVSQGQFGQYPLYVFKNEAIYALEQSQSADVVFGRITPIDVSMGVADDWQIVNVGQSIVFANDSGIYFLEGGRTEKFSDPVKSILPNIKALGYLRREDDEELLVSIGTTIYRYSLKYGRWYTSTSIDAITHFFTDNEALYGLTEEYEIPPATTISAKVLDFQSPAAAAVNWRIGLKGVHFGLPDILKRFYLLYLRATIAALTNFTVSFAHTEGTKNFTVSGQNNRPKWGSEYECDITIVGSGTPSNTEIHKIDAEFSPRYPRKQRSS